MTTHPRRTVDPDEPVVFIDRHYDGNPPFDSQQSGWEALLFHTGIVRPVEKARFDDADDAVAWARDRAEVVWVRLGASWDTHYSAGAVHLHQWVDGSGAPFPNWPPDNWPEYKGPSHEPRRYSPDDGVMGSSSYSQTLTVELGSDEDPTRTQP